ncbi:coiled-coil domain-containing protein 169 isoform X2 [Nelusetta ayraudi]|uniref:coiled-coil domain-containing protein 169 isoform X2 n=1 Tax=Nelusetta ayraudi TaxID=303726 RepID=UPI003F7144FF
MSGFGDYSKLDLARMQAELDQETEVKEMLEESVSGLRSTMCELQERLNSVDENEWKTRYETQVELNGQLERQTTLMEERLGGLRGNPVDRLASIRSYDVMSIEALRQRLQLLTEERSDLQSQLMDCHLRIEQEGKAFLKTNDERRAYLSEVSKLSSTLQGQRRQYSNQTQRAPESKQRRVKHGGRKAEADVKRAGGREEDSGGVLVKGGDGGRATAERRVGSRLPTLKYFPKHSP